jgi:RNA polymerase sigma-70 factor, ECF subfamily
MDSRQQAFSTLVHSLQAELYRLAYWLCKNQAQAQDILQEAYLRAWKSMDNLRDQSAARAWLMTIVRREYLRTFERKKFDTVELDEQPIIDDAPGMDQLSDVEQVRAAIGQLEAKYRVPLVLQVVGGLSCSEIADELSLSEAAVMTQLFRARQKIKVLLEPNAADAQSQSNVIKPDFTKAKANKA